MSFEDKIISRKLNSSHVFIATFLGALAEGGFLNKGVLNIVIPKVAEKIVTYLKFKHGSLSSYTTSIEEQIKLVLRILKEELDPFINYLISVRENKITIAIETNTCKFCPKGVGEADLPGILCVFPQLIKGVLKGLIGGEYEINVPLVKKSGYCVFQIEKKVKQFQDRRLSSFINV